MCVEATRHREAWCASAACSSGDAHNIVRPGGGGGRARRARVHATVQPPVLPRSLSPAPRTTRRPARDRSQRPGSGRFTSTPPGVYILSETGVLYGATRSRLARQKGKGQNMRGHTPVACCMLYLNERQGQSRASRSRSEGDRRLSRVAAVGCGAGTHATGTAGTLRRRSVAAMRLCRAPQSRTAASAARAVVVVLPRAGRSPA